MRAGFRIVANRVGQRVRDGIHAAIDRSGQEGRLVGQIAAEGVSDGPRDDNERVVNELVADRVVLVQLVDLVAKDGLLYGHEAGVDARVLECQSELGLRLHLS